MTIRMGENGWQSEAITKTSNHDCYLDQIMPPGKPIGKRCQKFRVYCRIQCKVVVHCGRPSRIRTEGFSQFVGARPTLGFVPDCPPST